MVFKVDVPSEYISSSNETDLPVPRSEVTRWYPIEPTWSPIEMPAPDFERWMRHTSHSLHQGYLKHDWSVFATRVEQPDESALDEIESLEDNWDGEGSLAPTAEIVDATRRIVQATSGILPRPEITPNDNGTITIEWRAQADYASLEVGSTSFAFMMQFDRTRTRFLNGRLGDLDASMAVEVDDALFWRRPISMTVGQGWAINTIAHY